MDRLLGTYPEKGSIEIIARGFLQAESTEIGSSPAIFKKFTIVLHHPFRYYAAESLARHIVKSFEKKLGELLVKQIFEKNASIDPRILDSLTEASAQEIASSLGSLQGMRIDLHVGKARIIGNTCFVPLEIAVKDLHYDSSLISKVYPVPWTVFRKLLVIDLQPTPKQYG